MMRMMSQSESHVFSFWREAERTKEHNINNIFWGIENNHNNEQRMKRMRNSENERKPVSSILDFSHFFPSSLVYISFLFIYFFLFSRITLNICECRDSSALNHVEKKRAKRIPWKRKSKEKEFFLLFTMKFLKWNACEELHLFNSIRMQSHLRAKEKWSLWEKHKTE
jgi:hypothetical protein